jgi:hypothetical protein
MVRKHGRTAPLSTSAVSQELTDTELTRLVGGSGKQATTTSTPSEQVTFEYGSLSLQY